MRTCAITITNSCPWRPWIFHQDNACKLSFFKTAILILWLCRHKGLDSPIFNSGWVLHHFYFVCPSQIALQSKANIFFFFFYKETRLSSLVCMKNLAFFYCQNYSSQWPSVTNTSEPNETERQQKMISGSEIQILIDELQRNFLKDHDCIRKKILFKVVFLNQLRLFWASFSILIKKIFVGRKLCAVWEGQIITLCTQQSKEAALWKLKDGDAI